MSSSVIGFHALPSATSLDAINNVTVQLDSLRQGAMKILSRIAVVDVVMRQTVGLKVEFAFAKLRTVDTLLEKPVEARDFSQVTNIFTSQLVEAMGAQIDSFRDLIKARDTIMENGVQVDLTGDKANDLLSAEAKRIREEIEKVKRCWTLSSNADLQKEKDRLQEEVQLLNDSYAFMLERKVPLTDDYEKVSQSVEFKELMEKKRHLCAANAPAKTVWQAAEKGDVTFLETEQRKLSILSSENKFWSRLDENGNGMLHLAAAHGQLEAVQYLVAHGADAAQLDGRGFTPLHWAAFTGNRDIAQALLGAKVDPSIPGSRGRTPLHQAAASNQAKMVRFLLQRGANSNAQAMGESQITSLHEATSRGFLKTVEALLENSSLNVDLRDKRNHTSIYYAIAQGLVEIAALIVSHPSWRSPTDRNDPNHVDQLLKLTPTQNVEEIRGLLKGLPT